MKRLLALSFAACAIVSATALSPLGASARVRHIPISHAPRPPLTTIVIRPSSATTPDAGTSAACATCPQSSTTACAGCPPKAVQINLVQVHL